LGELFEKAEAVGDAEILSAVKAQVQLLREREQPLPPLARGDGAVNAADHHDADKEDRNHRRNREVGLVKIHVAFLNQSGLSGHYNFKRLFQRASFLVFAFPRRGSPSSWRCEIVRR